MSVKQFPSRYAKFLTALAGQALVYAQYTYGANNHWVEAATALAVAVGVLAVPNAPAPAPQAPPEPVQVPGPGHT